MKNVTGFVSRSDRWGWVLLAAIALGLLVWLIVGDATVTTTPAGSAATGDAAESPTEAAEAPRPPSSGRGGDAPPRTDTPLSPIRADGEVVRPRKISGPNPQYTEIARKARIQGVVIVEAIIDKTGAVRDARVLKPMPMGLDQAALDAIRQWQFTPATLKGEPVDVYYNLTVNFRLK